MGDSIVELTPDPSSPSMTSAPATRPTGPPAPVELSLPAENDLLVLARFTVSTLASRLEFDIDEIEDLRLAVDELCLLVLAGRRSGRLLLVFSGEEDRIDVWCHFDGPDGAAAPDPAEGSGELSARILDALVDEHGSTTRDGRVGIHLCKRRLRVDG